jgi:homogentisate 1,2-dioxygenase
MSDKDLENMFGDVGDEFDDAFGSEVENLDAQAEVVKKQVKLTPINKQVRFNELERPELNRWLERIRQVSGKTQMKEAAAIKIALYLANEVKSEKAIHAAIEKAFYLDKRS